MDGGNFVLPIRFDETYENYDPVDLEAILAGAARVFVEDQQYTNAYSIFFARQLDYIKAKVYERKYPDMMATVLVPDATDVPEWAETITVQTYDMVGMAKIIANYADDLPRADVRGTEITVRVKTVGDSYGYSVNELRASRATGAGLDSRKAEAARRAIEIKLNNIRLVGDSDYGLSGLFNNPNIPTIVLPNTAAWSGLTGEQIMTNLNHIVVSYRIQNFGQHTANILALSPNAYLAAGTKYLNNTGTTPVTVLEWFRKLNPGIAIENIYELAGAGASARDLGFFYENNTDNMSHEYVMPFTQLPPEARNLEFVVNCIARTAGVQVWYPLALANFLT